MPPPWGHAGWKTKTPRNMDLFAHCCCLYYKLSSPLSQPVSACIGHTISSSPLIISAPLIFLWFSAHFPPAANGLLNTSSPGVDAKTLKATKSQGHLVGLYLPQWQKDSDHPRFRIHTHTNSHTCRPIQPHRLDLILYVHPDKPGQACCCRYRDTHRSLQ